MKTSDMSLQVFLKQKRIGIFHDIPEPILKRFADANIRLAETETFKCTLQREFEEGELPALVTSYFLLSGYKLVAAKEREVDYANRTEGYEQVYEVLAEDSEGNNVLVTICHGKRYAAFTLK